MSKEIRRAATEFVDLVLQHETWSEVKWLHIDNLNILLAAVIAAGFEARAVRKGTVSGYFRGPHGEHTTETYVLNAGCRFKVIALDGGDHRLATLWLVGAVANVRMWRDMDNYSREDIIAIMMGVIEDSVPLRPIRLTNENDFLREFSFKDSTHTRDVDDVDHCVGVHADCDGWVERRKKNSTHDQLVCHGCYSLHVSFPREVKSYGELRQYLKESLAAKPGLVDRFFDWVAQLW